MVQEWVHRTEHAIDERTAPGGATARKYGAEPETADGRDALRAEQQDEAAEAWVGPGLGPFTDAQAKGLVLGTVVGALIGAVVFLPLGFVSWAGLGLGWRLAVAALCGALAGGVGFALYLGGREPELEGEVRDVDGRPSVGTTPRDPRTDAHGR